MTCLTGQAVPGPAVRELDREPRFVALICSDTAAAQLAAALGAAAVVGFLSGHLRRCSHVGHSAARVGS